MQEKRVALVTGANQGVGFQVAKDLVANGFTVHQTVSSATQSAISAFLANWGHRRSLDSAVSS